MVTFVVDIEWDRVEVDLVWNQSWELTMTIVDLTTLIQVWRFRLSLLLVVARFCLYSTEYLFINARIYLVTLDSRFRLNVSFTIWI